LFLLSFDAMFWFDFSPRVCNSKKFGATSFTPLSFQCNVLVWFFTIHKGTKSKFVVVIKVGVECMCQHNVVVDINTNMFVNRPLTTNRIHMYLLEVVWLTCMQNMAFKKCDKMIIHFFHLESFNGVKKYNNDHC
jgi:hypothetical protein